MTITDYDTALAIVSYSFAGKFDKSGEPYIKHLREVADTVTVLGPNQETKTIALLHDILEDCPEWNEKSLGAFFSKNIIEAVMLLTKKPGQSYEDYIEKIATSSWATAVKVADLKHNMDITRLKKLNDVDFVRLEKYHTAFRRLFYGDE